MLAYEGIKDYAQAYVGIGQIDPWRIVAFIAKVNWAPLTSANDAESSGLTSFGMGDL
jgi:hypothetical protein